MKKICGQNLTPMEQKKENNYHELLLKAERFCAYQERCSHELKQKLKELGADEKTLEEIITSIQEDDFQNDERFALLFTSGKFRIKRWGKIKIRSELRMKKIPDSLIKTALDSINETDYKKTIQHLIQKKEREVQRDKPENRKQKIFRFLLSKGFESTLILSNLKLQT